MIDMSFVYFICPENQHLSKYCEGFFNYLTYGYKTWTRDRYVSTSPKDKDGRSRLLRSKYAPLIDEMKANDPVFDRIHRKVITSDCYQHSYQQISEEEVANSSQIVYITCNKKPSRPPQYLSSDKNSVVMWKVSNIEKLTENKFELLEMLIRRMAKPHQS